MDFTFQGDELTADDLREFINEHKLTIPRLERLQNQYLTKSPILVQEKKESWKPDNRIDVNHAKKIVDTFNGFFSGIPVKLYHENEELNKKITDFWRRNRLDKGVSYLSKKADIFGHAYMYVWQNENSETEVYWNDPFDMFLIYDDAIKPQRKYGVRYGYDEDNKLNGMLFTQTHKLAFEENDRGDLLIEEPDTDVSRPNNNFHKFKKVPIIPFIENEEKQSIIEPVETLMNAFDKALSEKANDVEYFADAYLAILGAEVDEEGVMRIRDDRIINVFGTDDASKIIVEFLDKPDADKTQENLLNRLERLIYNVSMIPNINDETFGESSGIALAHRLQPMKNLATTKEREFTDSLEDMFELFMSVPVNVPESQADEWQNIEFTFTRDLPNNTKDEAEVAEILEGMVSKETQLSVLSIIDDASAEIEKMEEERTSESDLARSIELNNRMTDQNLLGGETDGE